MGQLAPPSLPPRSSKLYWNSAPVHFSVGILYNFIKLQCVGVMPTRRIWFLEQENQLCCRCSDMMAPITGGLRPQICSGCVRNTRESRSRYLSVAAATKADVVKITGGETEPVCFHTQIKSFMGAVLQRETSHPEEEKPTLSFKPKPSCYISSFKVNT